MKSSTNEVRVDDLKPGMRVVPISKPPHRVFERTRNIVIEIIEVKKNGSSRTVRARDCGLNKLYAIQTTEDATFAIAPFRVAIRNERWIMLGKALDDAIYKHHS
jgi:hypothetical protein